MKLSELDFDKATLVFPLVLKMRYNPQTVEYFKEILSAETNKNKNKEVEVHVYDMFVEMIKNEPQTAKELFALLNDIDVKEYKPNAATFLNDMITAFLYDDDLMRAFGLRTQETKKASTGSATENTEA